jgi:hypothetical protein
MAAAERAQLVCRNSKEGGEPHLASAACQAQEQVAPRCTDLAHCWLDTYWVCWVLIEV